MQILSHIVLVVHFIGWAALFGGLFVQLKDKRPVVNAAMLHGALTQLVTGLLLVGLLEMRDFELNHVKVGIKLAVTIVITVVVLINKRKTDISKGLWGALLLLSLFNAAIAVMW